MNELQKAYCDGAAMAYQDASDKLRDLMKKAPAGSFIAEMISAMEPFADALDVKAVEVYKECDRFMGKRQ